jgi:predicted MPP superfamily phosphohydrolase
LLTRRGFLKLVLRGAIAAAALTGLPVYEAMATPRVAKYQLTPPNWTPGLKLRIAALADFHACDPWMTADRIQAICEQANALEPDIILLLGDYAASMRMVRSLVDPRDWSKAMTRLKAPLGVHAIMGNHDYWDDATFQNDPSSETFGEKALRDVGIPVYINHSARLEKDGHPFWLAGLGDQMALLPNRAEKRYWTTGIDNLNATLAQVTDQHPVILLAHEPDIFAEISPRVSLTLSGHTHGGQVNLFGWTPIVPSRYGSRYVGGHVVENDNHIIVSRGLGCSGLPIRFGAWPEILQIELG